MEDLVETDFEARLRTMVEELEASPELTVKVGPNGPLGTHLGSPAEALKKIGDYRDITLPPSLAENFHRHSDFHVYWRSDRPGPSIGGELRLTHIGVAIMSAPAAWPADVARNDKERELFRQLKFFDMQPTGGLGTCAAFRVPGDGGEPEVWYFDPRQLGFLRLDIGYGGYLDKVLLTRGLYYWQYLFVDPGDTREPLSETLSDLGTDLAFLENTFPDDDFSELRDRLRQHQE